MDDVVAWGVLVLVLLAVTALCVGASRRLGGTRSADHAESLAARRTAVAERDAAKAAGLAAFTEERMRGGGNGF